LYLECAERWSKQSAGGGRRGQFSKEGANGRDGSHLNVGRGSFGYRFFHGRSSAGSRRQSDCQRQLRGGFVRIGRRLQARPCQHDVTGWFIPATDGTYPWGVQNGAFGASTPFGNQWIVIGECGCDGGAGPHDYSIQQTMTHLVVGATYDLSFAISSEFVAAAGSVVQVISQRH
jgi:hypothetical protein